LFETLLKIPLIKGVIIAAYIIISIAPPVAFLFYFDKDLFFKLDFLKLLLLCFSLGGFFTIFTIGITLGFAFTFYFFIKKIDAELSRSFIPNYLLIALLIIILSYTGVFLINLLTVNTHSLLDSIILLLLILSVFFSSTIALVTGFQTRKIMKRKLRDLQSQITPPDQVAPSSP